MGLAVSGDKVGERTDGEEGAGKQACVEERSEEVSSGRTEPEMAWRPHPASLPRLPAMAPCPGAQTRPGYWHSHRGWLPSLPQAQAGDSSER